MTTGSGSTAGAAAARSGDTGGAAGLAVFTRRGGGSDGAVFTGSGALAAGLRPFAATGVSANDAFDGTLMFR